MLKRNNCLLEEKERLALVLLLAILNFLSKEIQKQIPIAAETPASKASRAKGLEKAANKQPEIEFLEDKPKEDSSFTSSRGQAEVVLVDRPVGTIIPQRVTPPPSEISRGTQASQIIYSYFFL
jgi:hypothetical protein